MYWPASRNERWLCWTVFVQTVAVLVLEIYNLSQWESWIRPNGSQVAVSYLVPINLSLIMFAVFYESLLSLKLVHDKSNILLVAICVSKACIFAYSIMQYTSMHENTVVIQTSRDMFNQPLVDLSRDLWKEIRPAEMMVPIIVGIATVIVCPVAYQLHKEYSWAIYQCVQGDPKIRFRYRGYEVYLVLIIFDIYFFVGFIIQYNLVDVHFIEPEFSLTMALIPTVVMIMVLSVYFVRYENRIGTIIVIISYLGFLAYIISRIIVLCGHGLFANTPGKDMMLLFAFVALIFTFLAAACAIYCFLNFEHGLKSVFDRKSQIPRQSFAFQELPSRDDNYLRTADLGKDWYAAQTWFNSPDGEAYGIGWASNWQYCNAVPAECYRSAMSPPRKFTIREVPLNVATKSLSLISRPIDLNIARVPSDDMAMIYTNGSAKINPSIEVIYKRHMQGSGSFEFKLKIKPGTSPARVSVDIANANGHSVGLNFVLQSEGMFISMDRGRIRTGSSWDHPLFDDKVCMWVPNTQNIYDVHVIIDAYVCELFAIDGAYAFTNTFFLRDGVASTLTVSQDTADTEVFEIYELYPLASAE